VWHSSLSFPATKQVHEVTKEEAIRTIGREMRRLRKLKEPSPQQLQRADAIRNLILLWQSLTTAEPEPLPKPLTYEERVRMVEAERKEK
jgi:hypothetical protein